MSVQFIEYADGTTEEMFIDERPDWMRLVDHAGVATPQGLTALQQRMIANDEEQTEEN